MEIIAIESRMTHDTDFRANAPRDNAPISNDEVEVTVVLDAR
jgi:hypothetical protein